MIKAYYKFNNSTCAKTFSSEKVMQDFFNKHKMLKVIRIEKQ